MHLSVHHPPQIRALVLLPHMLSALERDQRITAEIQWLANRGALMQEAMVLTP